MGGGGGGGRVGFSPTPLSLHWSLCRLHLHLYGQSTNEPLKRVRGGIMTLPNGGGGGSMDPELAGLSNHELAARVKRAEAGVLLIISARSTLMRRTE